jgi:hypothetical protein
VEVNPQILLQEVAHEGGFMGRQIVRTAASLRQLQCVDPSDGFLRVADKILARKNGVSTLADWPGS